MRTIALYGETASGKTAEAVKVAKRLGAEIVCADAFQVYKGLAIATAQPTEEEKDGVPHHLFGFLSPDEPYSVAVYQKDARRMIEEIHARGHHALLVGGSGLYIRGALYDYLFPETQELPPSYYEKTTEELFALLQEADPKGAEQTDPFNRIRVLRALTLALSGHPKGEAAKVDKEKPLFDAEFYWLRKDRDLIKERVNLRVERMVESGLFEEIASLLKEYPETSPAFRAIGVKELIPYFLGNISKETAIEEVKKDTMGYVKRQATFFRHQFLGRDIQNGDEII